MTHRKKCIACNKVKDIDQYYVHKAMTDGHLNKCKECVKTSVKKRYYEKHDEILKYEKSRASLPHRVAARKVYAATKRGKDVARAAHQKQRIKNPERIDARTKLNNAIRDGKVIKPSKCGCGKTGNLEAHHDDYKKPLKVKWLCVSCHKEEHKGKGIK
jgi:hypothetical protein